MQVLVTLQIEQRIFPMLAVEFFCHVIDDRIIPILAPEPVIAIRRDHVDVLALNAHDRDVESSATEIEDEHGLILVEFVETVCQRRGRRLVNDLQNIDAGQLTGSDGRSSFRVIEVGGNCDDSVGDRLFEILLRVQFELL